MERIITFNDGHKQYSKTTVNNEEWIDYTEQLTNEYRQHMFYLVFSGYDHMINRVLNTFITCRKQEFLNYCDSDCCLREDIMIMVFENIQDVLCYLEVFNELEPTGSPFNKKLNLN
jgi:hypothetical protein